MKVSVKASILMGIAVLALTGCGKSSKPNRVAAHTDTDTAAPAQPTAQEISNLILQYEREHCAWNTYSYPYARFQQILAFFSEQVRARFLAAGPTGEGLGSRAQNFPYVDHYGANQLAQLWWEPPVEVRVKECMYLPTGVTVLDTTNEPSGKAATVIFRNSGYELTDFGTRFAGRIGIPVTAPGQYQMWIGETKDHNSLEIDNTELVAQLQKLDATGWRVDSISASGAR